MSSFVYALRIVTEEQDSAGKLVPSLFESIDEFAPDVTAAVTKERSDTQDFGATLVLILGAPATIALATAIATFIKRNSGVKIEMTLSKEQTEQENPSNSESNMVLKVENLDSSDAAEILRALAPK